jgi:ribosomal protein L3 glutamine methyltransferase
LIFGQGAKTAEEEAWWLVEHLACPVVSREKLDKMLKRRLDGEPMAYITEKVCGCLFVVLSSMLIATQHKVRLVGLDFKCDARAIIPRSYIAELLADKSLLEHFVAPPKRALDLCCGNANLAIAALVNSKTKHAVVSNVGINCCCKVRMPSLVSCTASDLSDHVKTLL